MQTKDQVRGSSRFPRQFWTQPKWWTATNQHCHPWTPAASAAKNQDPLSSFYPMSTRAPFAAKKNKVFDNDQHQTSSLPLPCSHTLTFLMARHPDQRHDLRVFTLLCRPQVTLCSQRENPLRGNTKTGKTVCLTHHTALTPYAYDWCYGLAWVQGSVAQPFLPLLVFV